MARIAALTSGQGVDSAFDPMGSGHLRLSARSVRRGGTIVGFGFYAAANSRGNVMIDVIAQYLFLGLWSLPPYRKHSAFYDIRSLHRNQPGWFLEDLTALLDMLAQGKLRPVIAARLPLEEVVHAHQQVERAAVQGKLVLIPNP